MNPTTAWWHIIVDRRMNSHHWTWTPTRKIRKNEDYGGQGCDFNYIFIIGVCVCHFKQRMPYRKEYVICGNKW